jgi:hypothetical protein
MNDRPTFWFPVRDVFGLLVYLAGLTVVLIAIVVAKGERSTGWRWGKK